MNELLTRDLTTDELSLISGGGESDQNGGFGLREIWDYWDRQLDLRFSALDNNGDGDGWDEISYTYNSLGAATAITGAVIGVTGGGIPLAGAVGVAAGAFFVVGQFANGMDLYGMPNELD
jgi:hypothetical protein